MSKPIPKATRVTLSPGEVLGSNKRTKRESSRLKQKAEAAALALLSLQEQETHDHGTELMSDAESSFTDDADNEFVPDSEIADEDEEMMDTEEEDRNETQPEVSFLYLEMTYHSFLICSSLFTFIKKSTHDKTFTFTSVREEDHTKHCYICKMMLNTNEYIFKIQCDQRFLGQVIYGYPNSVHDRTMSIHLVCLTHIATLARGAVVESHENLLKSNRVLIFDADKNKFVRLGEIKSKYDFVEKIVKKNYYADKDFCKDLRMIRLEEFAVVSDDSIGDRVESEDESQELDNESIGNNTGGLDVSSENSRDDSEEIDVTTGCGDVYPPAKISTLVMENLEDDEEDDVVEFHATFATKVNKNDDNIIFCKYKPRKGTPCCLGYYVPANIDDVTNPQLDCYPVECSVCPKRHGVSRGKHGVGRGNHPYFVCKVCKVAYCRYLKRTKCTHDKKNGKICLIISLMLLMFTTKQSILSFLFKRDATDLDDI